MNAARKRAMLSVRDVSIAVAKHPPELTARRLMDDTRYDGHTLRTVIEDTQMLTGCEIERAYVDKGYRGHDAENPRRAFISGQKRGVFGTIKRKLRRRSAIEAVV